MRCPKCGQIDMVRKVSAIWTEAGRPLDKPGSMAGSLAPPPVPGWYFPPGLDGSVGTAAGGAGLLGVVIALIVTSVSGRSLFSQLGVLACLIAGAVGFLVLFVFAEVSRRASVTEKRAEYEKACAEREKAVDVWGTVYFCARDDIVFRPDTGEYAPRGKLVDLCYGRARDGKD